MSEWDFLWGLTGNELMDAMASGGTPDDWAYIEEQEIRHKKKGGINENMKKKIKQDAKKKNTLLLIDAENVSHKKVDVIMRCVELQGVMDKGKVYGRQKDPHIKGWAKTTREYGLEDIRLSGPPQKDKVDKKIQKDARREISEHKNLDIVCLVTSDSGYVDTVDALRSRGKRVVVMGEKKASEALRKSCSQFIEI